MRLSRASSLCSVAGVIDIAPCSGQPLYECISPYGHIKLYVALAGDVKFEDEENELKVRFGSARFLYQMGKLCKAGKLLALSIS